MTRGSHAQYVPHVGWPQIMPVPSATAVNVAPAGAQAAATACATLMRQMSPMAAATAIQVYVISESQAVGTCTYMMRTVSLC